MSDGVFLVLPSHLTCSTMPEHNPKESIIFKLQTLLEENKVYLKKNISAKMLCKSIGCNPRDLPKLVKNEYGIGINRLINQYRIRHSIELIDGGYLKKRTVESLALEVGFRSRNTFYLAFKNETGLSPSVFVNSVVDVGQIGLLKFL